jgi:hypothetical protein
MKKYIPHTFVAITTFIGAASIEPGQCIFFLALSLPGCCIFTATKLNNICAGKVVVFVCVPKSPAHSPPH